MYSILSVDATESLGSLKIHSHHDSAFAAAQALDDHIRQFAAGQNTAQSAQPDVKFQVEKWEALPDGTIFVVATDEFTLQVWRKYSKPGRLYGSTPKRTKLATFVSVRQEEEKKPVVVKTPVKSVNLQALMISELKEKLEQRRQNEQAAVPIKARRVSQVQEEKINFDECFPSAAISPPRFVQTTLNSAPTAPSPPVLAEGSALPVFEWPTTAFDFPTATFTVNPLWQFATVNSNVEDEAAVESSEWSTSSDEEYYQRPAKRQQIQDEYDDEDDVEDDESVFTSEASDDEVDAHWSYRPPLAESIEVSQNWHQWNDMLTPLLENGQNDEDEHPYGAPAEIDWLDSYQQIVNQWRAAHGLPTEYFL